MAARISQKTQAMAQRMTRLRNGPASFSVPSTLQEIEMTFAKRNRDYGARKFWQLDSPSLLFANSHLAFKINRPERIENPEMVLRYTNGTSKSIPLKMKSDAAIREELRRAVLGETSLPSESPKADIQPPTEVTPIHELESGADVGTARQ